MKLDDANLSLKQGLYKLYLLKTLKNGIELKEIKENINGYLQEESIGAGYRNLVRDYVKEGLVQIEDKRYQLTQDGELALESLSQNLMVHAGNFNDVPTPDLVISDELIKKFNFKEHQLEIKQYFSLNKNLNNELEKSFEKSQNDYKKEVLTSLVFSNDKKATFFKDQFNFNYIENITKIVSPKVISYFAQSNFHRNYKLFFSCIWTVRLLALAVSLQTFGMNTTLQALKGIAIVYFIIKMFQKLCFKMPTLHRSLTSINASVSFFLLASFYLYNSNNGLDHHQIGVIDIFLCSILSLEAISFYLKHAKFKGMSFIHNYFDRYKKYKVPAITFYLGFIALFFQVTYQLFTVQLANIIALFSLIPLFIGYDLFGHYENVQAATLDIKNK